MGLMPILSKIFSKVEFNKTTLKPIMEVTLQNYEYPGRKIVYQRSKTIGVTNYL